MPGIKNQKWSPEKKGKRTDNIKIASIISREADEKLKQYADKKGVSKGKMITAIIEKYFSIQ